jgi:hypothetical protein
MALVSNLPPALRHARCGRRQQNPDPTGSCLSPHNIDDVADCFKRNRGYPAQSPGRQPFYSAGSMTADIEPLQPSMRQSAP